MTTPSTTAYPNGLDTVSSLLQVVNNFATYLPSVINNAQTTIPLASTNGLIAPGIVSINNEVVYYAGISGNSLTGCIRGYDGTTAEPAAVNDIVEQRWVANHHNLLASAIAAIQLALGITPQSTAADVATLLSLNLPSIVTFASPTTNWSWSHNRGRIVMVQLWRLETGTTYELMDSTMEQNVNPSGPSTVTITLPTAEAGYAIFS